MYPYYLSETYREYYHRLIYAFADYVHSLPREIRERIVFVQVCEGSTGDGQPYKSQPLNPAHRISFDQWSDFGLQAWQVYADAFQKGRAHPVHLLVNGDANREQENAWLIANWRQIGVKQGMFSHGYIVSDTTDRVAAFGTFKQQAREAGAFVFTRGEQDGEWKTYGWSTKNPVQAFYWSGLFAPNELQADPGDTRNRAEEYPRNFARLTKLAQTALADLGAALTGQKGTGIRPAGSR